MTDPGTPSELDWRERSSFTARALLSWLLVELVMRSVCVAGYFASFEAVTAGAAARVLFLMVPAMAACGAALAALFRPIERQRQRLQRGALTDDELRELHLRLERLPRHAGAMWTIQWVTYFAALFLTNDRPPSWIACSLFVITMLFGPLLVGHSLTAWLSAPLVRRLSLLARERKLELPSRELTLRRWLAFYSACMGMAPATYTASMAIAAQDLGSSRAAMLTTVSVSFLGVLAYTMISALLIAATLSEPIGAMVSIMRRIIQRGAVSRVGRVPRYHQAEVGAMSDVTNDMLDRLEVTEGDRERAAASLAQLNQTLEKRVEDRTAEIQRRAADMRMVLDNVTDGLFIVDAAGAMAPEHSASLEAWFGAPAPGEHFCDYLARTAPAFALETRTGWQQIAAGFLPIEVSIDQMPRRVMHGGRHYELSYRPLGTEAEHGLLVVVSDATARLAQEAAEREKRETFTLLERATADRTGFLGFMSEGAAYVRLIAEGRASRFELKRALHTLKGNALLFGVESVGALCHRLESYIEEQDCAPPPAQTAELAARWQSMTREVDRFIGERTHIMELDPAQQAALEHAIARGDRPEALLAMLRELKLEPVERRLAHFAEQARQIAERLGKAIEVRVIEDGLRLDARWWGPIWSALVHPLRNAVDHGIEAEEEREAQGKPPAGRLELRAHREAGRVVIEIEDDGRGIAWESVRLRARALGLPAETAAELEAALFADGVSTAAEVSDLSGRGVGMGALRAKVLERGGAIELVSEPGRGTRLRIEAPEAPPPEELRLTA